MTTATIEPLHADAFHPLSRRLARNPFKDTIDSDLFFRTRQHEQALIKIRCGIEDGHALILLTGPSGTGKTLVSQVACRSLPPERYAPALVGVHPGLGKGGLLHAIAQELDIPSPARYTSRLLHQIQERTAALHESGRRPVVVIDEAHFLKSDALHILRTLSNLETETEKLVTVLLIAEDSFQRRLRSPAHASLRGRITFHITLTPLSAEETEQFAKYRLLKCKAPLNLIDRSAYEAAWRHGHGVPREIIRLFYNAFLETLTSGHPAISAKLIEQVAASFR